MLELALNALDNGGGTYVPQTTNKIVSWKSASHTTGYYVAEHYGIENLPETALSVTLLEEFFNTRPEQYEEGFRPVELLGLWRDERGLWSVDSVHHFNSLDEALYWGKVWNQRAIWSIETSGEVIL